MARKRKKVGKIGRNSGRIDRVLKSLRKKPSKSDWGKGILGDSPFSKK